MAFGATAAARRRRLRGMEFPRRGGEMLLAPRRDWAIRVWAAAASRRAARRPAAARLEAPAALAVAALRRNRRGADRAQIAFDHRQPIDHMAERVVNGFERILGVAVGFRLAEADVGQFALDDIDQAAVRRCAGAPAALGQRGEVRMLGFEMAQNVLQPVLDPSEIAGAVIGGGFEPFEQIGHALFEMGEGGGVVVADRHAVEAVGQRPQRAFEMFGVFAGRRPLAAFQRRGQRGDALFEDRERIAVAFGAGQAGRPWTTAVRTSSLSRASASLEATLETMERSAAMAPSSWWTVEGSSLARKIRSSLAPRLRIASS